MGGSRTFSRTLPPSTTSRLALATSSRLFEHILLAERFEQAVHGYVRLDLCRSIQTFITMNSWS